MMSKISKIVIALSLLAIVNLLLLLFIIKPAMNNDVIIPSGEEKNARIISIATWWGIPQTGLEMRELIIWWTSVIAEIADTQEKRRVGEMFRWAMGERDAMVFVFDQEQVIWFWMKNTYIGLDLLYVGSDGIIKHIHNNAKPLDNTSLPSIYPVQYVIEVRDDFVENFAIKVGDKVEGIN